MWLIQFFFALLCHYRFHLNVKCKYNVWTTEFPRKTTPPSILPKLGKDLCKSRLQKMSPTSAKLLYLMVQSALKNCPSAIASKPMLDWAFKKYAPAFANRPMLCLFASVRYKIYEILSKRLQFVTKQHSWFIFLLYKNLNSLVTLILWVVFDTLNMTT